MLDTTMVRVAPISSFHRDRNSGGTLSRRSRADIWMLRVAVALVASSSSFAAASLSTVEPLDSSGARGPVASAVFSGGGNGEESLGAMAQALASGKGTAAALSLLESLLASLDAFLTEFGLPSASVVCAALVAVAILAFAFVYKVGAGGGAGSSSTKNRKGVVLFLGPCGSGKTAMCRMITHGEIAPTVTSMQCVKYDGSRVIAGAGPSSVTLVDYPGHERLRGGVREELRRPDRVVFVLDGSCLAAQIAAGAELLYDVLTDPSLEGCRGLMLALNKSDVKEAKVSRAKILLQKELEKLRGTRGTLGTQGEEDAMPDVVTLGRPGQPFSLEVDSPCEVAIATCSVVEEGGLEPVAEFVRASVL